VDDKRLILWIALAHEGEGCRVHALLSGFHAAAVADHQSQTNWYIFMFEYGDFLLRPVLEYPEIIFFQVSDGMILLIGDIDVHLSEVHIYIEFIDGFLSPKGRNQEHRNKDQTLHFHHHHSSTGGILAEGT